MTAHFGATLTMPLWYANFVDMSHRVDDAIAKAVCGTPSSHTVKPDGAMAFAKERAPNFNVVINDTDATEEVEATPMLSDRKFC